MVPASSSMRSRTFWETISEHVTATVEPVLQQEQRERESVIVHLHGLEALARCETVDREAIQIITSGPSILGDRRGTER